jgi:hypothetical protein
MWNGKSGDSHNDDEGQNGVDIHIDEKEYRKMNLNLVVLINKQSLTELQVKKFS